MIAASTATETVLRQDEGGVFRIGDSRVSLDSVVYAFNEGASPEEIVWRFPTLDLVQVYSVINYYLHHQEGVDAYLQTRRQQRAQLKKEIESRFSPQGIRERLLARKVDQPDKQ
ncbi:MAG: DUF433 domain-containing protein [Acidobacteria bacterium]|nr:DUF433 domain-containing protein [Acidobacteriota bacterium]